METTVITEKRVHQEVKVALPAFRKLLYEVHAFLPGENGNIEVLSVFMNPNGNYVNVTRNKAGTDSDKSHLLDEPITEAEFYEFYNKAKAAL